MNGARTLVAFGLIGLLTLSGLPGQTAQSLDHPAGACSAPYWVSHAGWDVCWQADDPRAQGVELNQVYFQGASVLWKIGAPFSMTQYDNNANGPFKDTLGNPGAGGHPGYGLGRLVIPAAMCPRFHGSGTLLDGAKICVEERGGVEPALVIWARYNIYNYRFIQGYMMDARGNMEPFVRMGGNLIDGNSVGENGANHFHHIIWRADFDIGAPGNDVAEVYRHPVTTPGLSLNPETLLNGAACDGLAGILSGWTPYTAEANENHDPCLAMKWRVKGIGDLNSAGRERSFEFKAIGDASANTFATMDFMVVQYKGDSTELGYEVPTNPTTGDQPIHGYFTPAEPIDDPVVWLFQHAYHDTRDEDRGSMTYHHAQADIHPRNFHGQNVGEDTHP